MMGAGAWNGVRVGVYKWAYFCLDVCAGVGGWAGACVSMWCVACLPACLSLSVCGGRGGGVEEGGGPAGGCIWVCVRACGGPYFILCIAHPPTHPCTHACTDMCTHAVTPLHDVHTRRHTQHNVVAWRTSVHARTARPNVAQHMALHGKARLLNWHGCLTGTAA